VSLCSSVPIRLRRTFEEPCVGAAAEGAHILSDRHSCVAPYAAVGAFEVRSLSAPCSSVEPLHRSRSRDDYCIVDDCSLAQDRQILHPARIP
jgi:hypothetical protein